MLVPRFQDAGCFTAMAMAMAMAKQSAKIMYRAKLPLLQSEVPVVQEFGSF